MFKKKEWFGFWLCIALLLFLTLVFSLHFRKEFHRQIIASEHGILNSELASLSEEIEFRLLERDLTLLELGFPEITSSRQELIEQLVLDVLTFPKVSQVYAYESDGSPLVLVTGTRVDSKNREFISKVMLTNLMFNYTRGNEFSLYFKIKFLEKPCILEVQIGEDIILSEWNAIDLQVMQQGMLIIGTGSILLFLIFRLLNRRIQNREIQLEIKNQLLQRTNQKLAQAYKSISLGALAGHLMHSLKTPLTRLQIITREAETKQNIDPKELHSIQVQIKELVSQSLNSLKEIEEQKKYYQVSLRDILKSIVTRALDNFPKGQIIVTDSAGLNLKMDNLRTALLTPIVSTLIENALESNDQSLIKLRAENSGSKVIIIVSDSSGGIPPAERPFLFDPTKSRKKGGTGLGLAIAQQLSQCMDAELKLIKSDISGSTFTISFDPKS